MPAAVSNQQETPVRVLTPSARARRRFPRVAAVAIVVAEVVALVANLTRGGVASYADTLAKIVAVIGAIAIGMWAEDRLHTILVGRHPMVRISVGILTPVLAIVVLLPLVFVGGAPFMLLGDEGTLTLSLVLGVMWVASASLGTLFVTLLDVLISTVVADFRSRVQLAVLGLMALTSAFAVTVYGIGRLWADKLSTLKAEQIPPNVSLNLGEGDLSKTELERLLRMSETSEVVALGFFVVMAMLTTPAVLSAAGKIAESVMERLHPLSLGFRAVADGDLAVRVEEAGSADFVRINRGFNEMTSALARSVSELTETNVAAKRFVPFAFLRLLGKSSIREVALGDHVNLEISILFSDIRGFTPLAERMGPEATFSFINRYLRHMEPEIHQRDGFINDIFGDGIMALFATGADAAVQAALGMLAAVRRFNEEELERGGKAVQMGIGINTGPLMLGTIGGSDRYDCTVVGDPANLASRVEGMTKMYGARLLISEGTFRGLNDPTAFRIREIDRVRAKGRLEPITLYEVIADDDDSRAEPEAFRGALEAWREGRFDDAGERFAQCHLASPDDGVVATYLARCAGIREQGAPTTWDGITDLASK